MCLESSNIELWLAGWRCFHVLVEDDRVNRMTRWGIGLLVVAVATAVIVQAVGRGDGIARVLAIFMSGVAIGIGLASLAFARVSLPTTKQSA